MLYDYNYYSSHPEKIRSVCEQRYVDKLSPSRWRCDICGRDYSMKKSLNAHRKPKHPIRSAC